MWCGAGKTKVSIALIYRLLKAQRFRRVLFLVDRSALGEQAANAFKDTRMENLQTFADIFGIKELDDQAPDTETAVHIATVQGMVQRVLYTREGEAPPPVDQYDCIVVDECHRGYLLDRELSDAELAFRGYEDYISKYRRVIEYFDAVKVGLTEMRPVVVDPQISFTQLVAELALVSGDEERAQVRDQFVAKLQRKKGRLSEPAARDFETVAGMAPGEFIAQLQAMPLHQVAA